MIHLATLPRALNANSSAPLTSNQDSAQLPFQRWYNFKEAFAPQLIADVIHSLPHPATRCLDPFGGSGTTALACQFLGVQPTIIEVNPFLADLAEAKLATYDVDALIYDRGRLADFLAYDAPLGVPTAAFPDAPATLIEPGVNGRWIFGRRVAERIWQYRTFVDALENLAHARLFRVLLGATLVAVSNVTISGKGRRYRSKWRERPSIPEQVDELFDHAFEAALYDICRYSRRACYAYEVIRGDARGGMLEGAPFDVVVTSPPYPNSFDYTDIYNVELWALGYLQSRKDNRTLRESTVRSHVQIKRSFDHAGLGSALLLSTLESLEQVGDKLWDKDIPAMVGSYFAGLGLVLSEIRAHLQPWGTVALVVGDSRYADVRIDVAGILSQIAVETGFAVVDQFPVRSMRSSPQHGGRFDLSESLIRLVPS